MYLCKYIVNFANMDTSEIFALRLKTARQMRNLSMAALSGAIGNLVSPQAIFRYEAGIMMPASNVIVELSRALGVSMDYFFSEPRVSLSKIEFRKKYKLGAKVRKAIEMKVTNKLEKYVEISDICGEVLPELRKDLRVVSCKDDVLEVVSDLRKKWKLGDERIPNVIQFLEHIGILVVELEDDDNFDGFSGMADGIPVIALNKRYSSERKRFTALHELGHLVMTMDPNLPDADEEKLCHFFAGEMLITINKFKSITGDIRHKKISLQDFAELQKFFGISIDALMHKAYDFEMIGEPRYRNYNILKRTKPAFKAYAEESRFIDEHTDRFENLVYRAYTNELITGVKASDLLGITIQEVQANAMIV